MSVSSLTHPKPPKKKLSAPLELDEVADQVGEFIQYWGFKRVHGKIWAHLFLSAVPLDATTLVKRLGVSKALVSFSIHDLLEYKVIRQVARGRGRTVLFEANSDVTSVILSVLKLRERKLMAEVMNSVEKLSLSTPAALQEMKVSPDKLKEMREMIDSAQVVLDFILTAGPENRDMFNMVKAMVSSGRV